MSENIWKIMQMHTNIGKLYSDYDFNKSYSEPQENYYNIEEIIKLKDSYCDYNDGILLKECLLNRKSTRGFSDKQVNLDELSNMLFWSYGALEDKGGAKHTVPSAGARFPIEIHIVNNKVDGLNKGIYHYDYKNNCLERTSDNEFEFNNIYLGLTKQKFYCNEISAVICLCADFERTITKYGDRGFRYVYLDAGHIGQNLYLTAVENKIGIVGIGGFYDNCLKQFLDLPYSEYPVYLFAIGKEK